jgi:hypothetical protein
MTIQSNLTIFANFYIDDEERFLRMKDSLQSMKSIIVDRYVVNVRGRFANQAIGYLKSNVESLFVFSIESSTGWFYDTSKLSHLIKTSYVLLWIEDHICMAPESINDVVDEMEKCNADLLTYTFWKNGKFLQRYSEADQVDVGAITWFDHTVEINNRLRNKSYLISYASIIKKSLFEKVIKDRGSEQRWPKKTPFDFEKAPMDIKWLPLRRANPKKELFASIDDEQGEEDGTSLQSRGLYPKRSIRRPYSMYSHSRWSRALKRVIKRLRAMKRATRPKQKFIYFIKALNRTVQTLQKYRLDYLISLIKPAKMDAPLPWVNYAAIDFIVKKLPLISNVFEYGSGQSTLFWLDHGKRVVSIEHAPEFYKQLSLNISQMNNIDYRLIEPEIDETGNPFNPEQQKYFQSSDYKGYSFKNYVESISTFPDESFDVVIIGGRSRPACISQAINKIVYGGLLILDNSDCEKDFKKISQLVAEWERHDFVGTVRGSLHLGHTSIFIRMATKVKPKITAN